MNVLDAVSSLNVKVDKIISSLSAADSSLPKAINHAVAFLEHTYFLTKECNSKQNGTKKRSNSLL